MNDDLVYWSVAKANQDAAGQHGPKGMTCPHCKSDDWRVYHGVDPQYASQYNPGEYVDFICVRCGYTDQQPC